MSDIDDFALRLLQRAQARQQVISENLNKENEISQDKAKIDIMIKKISETSPKKKDSEALTSNVNQILNLSSSPRRSPVKNYSVPTVVEIEPVESIQSSKIVTEDTDVKTENKLDIDDLESYDSDEIGSDEDVEDGRESVQDEYKTPDTCNPNSSAGIKSETRRTLKRLGQLYGDATIASPVHKHSELEKTPETPQSPRTGIKGRASPVARRSRLHALACTINEWEDDLSHHCSPTSRFNLSVTSKGGKGRSPPKPFASQLNGDTNMEAQGFVPTPSKDKMTYDYSTPYRNPTKTSPEKRTITSPQKEHPNRAPSPTKVSVSPMKETTFASAIAASQANMLSPEKSVDNTPRVVDSIRKKFEFGGRSPKKGTETKPIIFVPKKVEQQPVKLNTSVAHRAALYETKLNQTVVEKDPTELSVAERAKLFEKQAFLRTPKAASSFEPPKPLRSFATPARTGPTSQPQKLALPEKVAVVEMASDTSIDEQDDEMFMLPPPPPPMQPPMITTTSPSPIRSRRLSKSPTPKRSISPKSKYPGSRDVKRIKINEPKEGKMYPSLTDMEATETETENYTETEDEPMYEDEDMDSETSHLSAASSLGRHIELVAKRSSPAKTSPVKSPPRRNRHYRPTEDFSASLACRQIDAYIDDALEGQDYTLDTLIETELEAHASSTPIANSSMDDSEETKSLVTVISDETRKPSQLKLDLDFDDAEDAENVDANSSFGSYTATRQSLPNNSMVAPVENREPNADDDDASVVSFSCLDDGAPEVDKDNVEIDECKKDESDPLSTSSPHGHGAAIIDDSPANSPAHTPLMHTVSFYRKQQSKKYATPTPTASHSNDRGQHSPERNASVKKDVGDLIKKMEEEVSGHVKSIAQVSKALNLCKATVEFSESTENVECEKVLLVATQKRTALLNEIHRLKTEGALSKKSLFSPGKHDLGPSCRGNMTLSNVEVQLKRDFVSRAMKGDAVYHFVLLTKYRHQIEASGLISVGNGVSSSNIQGGVLHFQNEFTIGSLEPEFCVKLEIYLLQTQKEYLPHEAKYHIKKEPKTGILTPKKLKLDSHTAKYLGRPFQQSPAGPDSIKTTNFSLCGSLSIDISTLQRSHWTLEKNMTICPLEGSVSIKIQCSAEGGIEEKGFLTLFDDVSGYGAWHRRWCKLAPSQLAYWRYPEDETKKEPLGTVSLRKCVTNRVGPVPRDVCARANTFLLVTTRSPYDDDKDTLVTSCHPEYTAVRHLISADTKEERDVWVKQFNRALANLRAWDPHARSPDDTLF